MDRSKTRIFPLIELNVIRDLSTGNTVEANRLIGKFIRSVAPTGQVISNVASTVNLGTVLESHFIEIATNQVTVKYTDFYDFSCVVTGNSSSQNILYLWIELLDPLTGLWSAFPESGRSRNFSNNNQGSLDYLTKLTIQAGTTFRFRAKTNSGTVQLGGVPFNTGSSVVGIPAVVFTMSRI